MAKTDWTLEDEVEPSDMNQIGQEINQLREDVDNIEIPQASLTQAGIVQLSNAANAVDEDKAATPKAVKTAYDAAATAQNNVDNHAALTTAHGATSTATANRIIVRDSAGRAKIAAPSASDDIARKDTVDNVVGNLSNLLTSAKGNTVAAINELFTSASNGKSQIAAAITGKGVPASGSDTFPVLAQKIGQIVTGKRIFLGSFETTKDNYTNVNDVPFRPKTVIIIDSSQDLLGVYSEDLRPYNQSSNTYLEVTAGGTGGRYSNRFAISNNGFRFGPGVRNNIYNYMAIE